MAFCFNDCACPAAEKYRHQVSVEAAEHFRSHPAVMKLVRSAASIVYESPDKTLLSDPHALRDALLAYVCHGAPLPCIDVGLLNKVSYSFPVPQLLNIVTYTLIFLLFKFFRKYVFDLSKSPASLHILNGKNVCMSRVRV